MTIRAIYLFDTMTDSRLVEGFDRIFDLTAVVPRDAGPMFNNPLAGDVKTVSLSGGRLRFVPKSIGWLIANRRRYDIVFVLDNLLGAFAANVAKAVTRKPVVLILARPTIEYFRCRRIRERPGVGYYARLALLEVLVRINERLCTAAGAISKHVAESCLARDKRIIAFYGVDTEVFTPQDSRQQARARIGLDQRKPVVFCRTRIAPEKDPETFLKAMSRISSQGREVTVLYVGGEHDEFSALARRYGVDIAERGHVHPLHDLPDYYRSADVVVQPSWAEGLGLSPLEALACGTPVVASAVGGLTETVVDGLTGLSVPAGDEAALASAVIRMLDDPSLAASTAKAGRELVLERYSSEVTMQQWLSLAKELVGRSANRMSE